MIPDTDKDALAPVLVILILEFFNSHRHPNPRNLNIFLVHLLLGLGFDIHYGAIDHKANEA